MPTSSPKKILVPVELLHDPDWLSVRFTRHMAQIDLLLLAEDGDVTVSYRELAYRWKWSVTRVIRFIDDLEANCVAKRFVGSFHGRKTKHLIRILSSNCVDNQNDSETFRETYPKESPLSPTSPEGPPTTPPYSLHPPISPLEKTRTQPGAGIHTSTCASVMSACNGRASTNALPPTPFPNPFILSSVERAEAMGDPAKIVMFKRMHLARNLAVVATLFCMDATAQKGFLDHWCSPSNRSPSMIRAEADEFFNLELRARSWMVHEYPPAGTPPPYAEYSQPSRAEQLAGNTLKANEFLKKIIRNERSYNDGTGTGATDYPDVR